MRISIPPSLTKIGENFSDVEIPHDSKLEIIEDSAFMCCIFDSFNIPQFVTKIGNNLFDSCLNLTYLSISEYLNIVQFESDSQLLSIGERSLSHSSFYEIVIPASVIKIEESAFARCGKLQKVDFEKGSKLQNIGKHAFSFTLLFDLTFPEELKEFGDELSKADKHISHVYIIICFFKLILSLYASLYHTFII